MTGQYENDKQNKTCKPDNLDYGNYNLCNCFILYWVRNDKLNDPYDIRVQFTEAFILGMFKQKKTSYIRWNVDINFIFEEFIRGLAGWQSQYLDLANSKYGDLEGKMLMVNQFEDVFTKILLKYVGHKVTCFTVNKDLSPNDLLMWSHYTSIFKGVKLKFDFSDHYGETNLLPAITEVSYRRRHPVNTIQQYHKEIFNKLSCWKYENEYRLISNENSYIPFERNHLKEITFGYNVASDTRNSFVRLIHKLGYHDCGFYRIKFINGILNKVPISYNPKHNEYFIDGTGIKK